jgi:transcriptional regulator with XRE-family HTH domain
VKIRDLKYHVDGFQISRIENGVHAPNLHTIRALAAALGRQPYELLKFDYAIKLNSDFSIKHRKRSQPGTSDFIRRLSDTNFFDSAKSVSEVVLQVKKEFHANLKSAATSGVLAKLTEEKILRRMPAAKSGHYLYVKRGR